MTTKHELHQLSDELPDDLTDEAASRLAELRDPLVQALLRAPLDDEPSTPEEDASLEAAWQDYLSGRARPLEKVLAELERHPLV